MTVTLELIQELQDRLKAATVPLPPDLMIRVMICFGQNALPGRREDWPDVNLKAAIAMVRGALGFASVAQHVTGTIDAWAGPHTRAVEARYAFSDGGGDPSLVLFRAGLAALAVPLVIERDRVQREARP